MNNLGKLLIAYRQKHDVDIRELGAEIGISYSTVSRIESGKPTDADNLVKIINWLFAKEDPVKSAKVDKNVYQGTGLDPQVTV